MFRGTSGGTELFCSNVPKFWRPFLAYSYRPFCHPLTSLSFLTSLYIYKFRNIGTNKRLTYINQRLTSVPNLFQMFQNWLFCSNLSALSTARRHLVVSHYISVYWCTTTRQRVTTAKRSEQRPFFVPIFPLLFQFFHFCSKFLVIFVTHLHIHFASCRWT